MIHDRRARMALTQINAAGGANGGNSLVFFWECEMSAVEITYFSDVLWAYVSQARVDAIKGKFGDAIHVEHRFCSVFGNTIQKINSSWKDKNGYERFNAHLQQVAGKFPYVTVHPELWLKTRPVTSASAHLFLKATQLLDSETAATPPPSRRTFSID